MKKAQLALSVLLLVIFVTACAPKAAQAPAPQSPAAAPAPAPAPARPAPAAAPSRAAWEVKWEETQAGAKREGRVVVLSSGTSTGRSAMVKGLKEFGINAEVSLGRINEFLPKVKAERLAGLYLWDVHIGGYNPILTAAKPEKIVDYPIDPQLILPDLTDAATIKKVWYQEKFPWVDKDHSVFILGLQPRAPVVINTNLVKEGDIKSWRDVLDPKWKGKIIVNDPTTPGAAQQWVGAVVKMMGEDFIKELIKTEPMMTRDERLHLDWVAQGKMAIALAPDTDTVTEIIRLGAPMKVVTPAEGGYMSGGATGVSLWNRAPHPNAARFFLNWIAGKEGNELFSAAGGYHSLRLDVSTAFLKPSEMRQAGVKYIDASTEEFAMYRNEVSDKIARAEFAKLKK